MQMKNILSLAAGLAVAIGFQGSALAAHRSANAVPGRTMQHPTPGVAKHKVLFMYTNSGDPNVTIAAFTFTDVDTYTVKCTKPTCTLVLSMMQQASFADDATQSWAMPVLVDGNYVDPGPYVGLLPGFASVANWEGSITVAQGNHTVEFQTYGSANYALGVWHDTVMVTAP